MIKLTQVYTGAPVYLNPFCVASVVPTNKPNSSGAVVTTTTVSEGESEYYNVSESADQVADVINGWLTAYARMGHTQ